MVPRSPANEGFHRLHAKIEQDYVVRKFLREYPTWLKSSSGLASIMTFNMRAAITNTKKLQTFLLLMGECPYWKTNKI